MIINLALNLLPYGIARNKKKYEISVQKYVAKKILLFKFVKANLCNNYAIRLNKLKKKDIIHKYLIIF